MCHTFKQGAIGMCNARNINGLIAFALSFILLSALVVPNARADEGIISQIAVNPTVQLSDEEKDSLVLQPEQILQQIREAKGDIRWVM